MADNDVKPMTDADIDTPPATTEFAPAEPLKDAGVEFEVAGSGTQGSTTSQGGAGEGTATKATQAIKEGATKLQGQATDKLRAYAQDGQSRAGGALDQLAQLLNDAAHQVDNKLGAQYGDYARQAAGTVSGFSDTVKAKDVDELFEEARGFVRKSPGVAIGAAAALGFVVARLVQSGLDAERGRTASNDEV
jgi:ElaB/YqjD/DUF883 family membrane-anchored ribosome-binding protein